jgi:hypothetical protein
LEGYCIESGSATITLALETNAVVTSYSFCKGYFALNKMKTTCLRLLTTGKGQVTANREVLSQHLTGGTNKNPEGKTLTIAKIPTECKSQFKNILKTNILVKLQDPFCYNFPTKLCLLILHNSRRATNFYHSMLSTFNYIQNKWI